MSTYGIKMPKQFVHCHVHDTFSLLDGISTRKDLILKAKINNMPAIATTNHGNMFNVISFYQDCVKENIKPIIGCEFYVAPDSRFNKVYSKKDEAEQDAKSGDLSYYAYHLTVLAKNRIGYDNLKILNTISFKEGFYKKNRIDQEALAANKEGLIVLSGCLAGKIARLIVADRKDLALEEINRQRAVFKENFYLELMSHGISEDAIVNEALI